MPEMLFSPLKLRFRHEHAPQRDGVRGVATNTMRTEFSFQAAQRSRIDSSVMMTSQLTSAHKGCIDRHILLCTELANSRVRQ